eukprot:gnl/TRDRNA2_/TRDRNA2_188774_c0_seq1.p1 gnl/TRDRNA2_/TRDRNA2_188774_c0~~gnl/TRDRNA2_/TRDRNA2_188774_c0_seq1.p1  ORF type:complete len:368 (+),score=26.19 gnl/TRDRNA2_/TRDRNA2_188774_c0_seq1:49-1152(+)
MLCCLVVIVLMIELVKSLQVSSDMTCLDRTNEVDLFFDQNLQAHAHSGFSRNCLRFTNESIRFNLDHFRGNLSQSAAAAVERWLDATPPEFTKAPPKLALLMTTQNTLLNSKLWLNWFEHARVNNQSYKLLIHAYGINNTEQFAIRSLREHVLTNLAPSKWCDIAPLQMALLEEALKDPDVTHMMMVSHDSIPLKSLKDIHAELLAEPRTRMCADDSWSIPRAETWWLMRRGDAEMFSHFRSTINDVFMKVGCTKENKCCTEENTFYLPLKMRMDRWGTNLGVLNSCPMFTDWKTGDSCKYWSNHAPDFPHLKKHVVVNASFAHPATFARLVPKAFRELRSSPFLFGRKFESVRLRRRSTDGRFERP